MTNWPNICFIIVTCIALITQILLPALRGPLSQLEPDLARWLTENNFEYKASYLAKSGNIRLVDVVELEPVVDVSEEEQKRFSTACFQLKQLLVLQLFLRKYELEFLFLRLVSKGILSLSDLQQSSLSTLAANPDTFPELEKEDYKKLLNEVPKDEEGVIVLSDILWQEIAYSYSLPSSKRWTPLSVALLVLALSVLLTAVVLVCDGVWVMTRTSSSHKHNFLHFFTGKYLHPQRCTTTFLWAEPAVVGNTVAFAVQFFQRNGRPYPISNGDGVVIEITQGIHKVGVVTELGGENPSEVNTARCKFTSRKSGVYSISIFLASQHIRGSPFLKRFLPGPPDPSKILMVQHTSTVVCTAGVSHYFLIEPRDAYLNLCLFEGDNKVDLHNYSIYVQQKEGGWEVDPESKITYGDISRRVTIEIKLARPGCYSARVSYCGSVITNGRFDIIVLTNEETQKVQKTVVRRSLEGCEARLLPSNDVSRSAPPTKAKKVFCYVTPKQLIIKEFLLLVIPKRLATFRLCPSTKLCFEGTDAASGLPALRIDDGCQPPVRLACRDRNVVAATFTQVMLRNIGGSETFKDKQDHFYHEVRKLHSRRHHDRLPFVVSRHRLLESAMKATKGFTVSDWCRNFEVTFHGEEGLDWGGLRREFFELLSVSLFDPANKLFAAFHEGAQAPVHPNPDRPRNLKLKHYEFAGRIVGKCLYESALGGGYRLSVKARFTRSFLAQLIGLRVHYKHFAHDDPSLYSGKVLHLLTHGTEDLDEQLYFVDDVIEEGECKMIELEPGGASREVTEENKAHYLDALAQMRLCGRVKHEIDAFMSGLNELIPDNLLCIFDESELELLMCGIEQYSILDLKANHVVSGSSQEFNRVLYWFWTAVTNFTDEEMARLLQFTTGCSRLPPGGFAQLSPHFQICPSHTFDNLPTAHTCFNQLCLPDYESYERFEKALLIAIKEGSEGFGMV